MFKVIITDLDRTLLHTDKTISPYTLQVLKHCKEKGIRLMAATARPLRAIEEYRKQLAFDALTVMNGAQVICGEHVECFGMSRESAGKVLEGLCVREGKGRSEGARMPECCGCVESAVAETVDKKPIPFSLEMGNEVYSNVPIPDWESVIYKDFPRLPEGEALYKIIVTLEEEATLRKVEEILPSDLYYTIANGHLIQIMSKSATKWNGIKTMLESVGCTPAEAIYFGDDFDDIEPLKMCGMGVAVANAIEEVKVAADYVTDSNDEDGVARFLEEIRLTVPHEGNKMK